MSEFTAELKEMAKLTVLSNRISEIQEKNLKLFPFIFFDSVSSARIEYDLGRPEVNGATPNLAGTSVSYYLEIDRSVNHHLPNRFKALEQAVKTLFWNDLTVKIFFGEESVYETTRSK